MLSFLFSFHTVNQGHLNKSGFKKLIHIGSPQFCDEWANVFEKSEASKAGAEKFVLVMSRGADGRYLDRHNYEFLLTSPVEAIKFFSVKKRSS